MKEKTYRVAIVGCGAIAPNHLAALAKIPYVRVVALCDKRRERAEAINSLYGLSANIYTDFDEMLSREALDSVHVTTPHFLHAQMAMKALDLGINVFLEKPMCISQAEIDAILEKEKKSQGRVCVCCQNRFNATTLLADKIIEEDGGALSAYGTVIWERDEKYYSESDWRGRWQTEGGGVLINQAIHTLDLLVHFLGKPEYLYATTANHHLKDTIEVEDSSEGMIVFESGKKASYFATTAFTAASKTNLFVRTKSHSIEISDAQIYVDGVQQTPESTGDAQIGKDCYGKGHYTLISEFYEALLTDAPMPVPLESAQWAVRILLAAYRSHDEKTPI